MLAASAIVRVIPSAIVLVIAKGAESAGGPPLPPGREEMPTEYRERTAV